MQVAQYPKHCTFLGDSILPSCCGGSMLSIWAMDVLDDKYNTEVKMAARWPDSACCALCRRKTVIVSSS